MFCFASVAVTILALHNVVQGHCTVWVGCQLGLSCTLLSHGRGCLILPACAAPLDRAVVVFVFGFVSVCYRHSLQPCPSVPASRPFCFPVFAWLGVLLGWLPCAVVCVAWMVFVRGRQGLVCGSPACWKGGERPRRDPGASAMHACAACVSLRQRVRSA